MDLRRVFRVESRGADHTQKLSGLVIVYADSAFASVQSLIGRPVQIRVQGEIYIVPAGGGAENGVEAVR